MGARIGVLAGAGRFALEAIESAKGLGYECVVAAIKDEAMPELAMVADGLEWFGVGELGKLLAFLKSRDVRDTVLLGKIRPQALFDKGGHDELAAGLLSKIKDRTPAAVLGAFLGFLREQGINVLDPGFLLKPYLCPEGVLTKAQPSPGVLADIDFGWRFARAIADLDIGQTIIVKDRAVVAVEGMEGTDETIRRAGRLAGDGLVAVKVGRSGQDMRIDVPAVGLETLRNLIRVRAAALCIEAQVVPFFQKEESLALAEANGFAVLAKKS
jgi:DUF1009 family protein